MDYAIIEIGGKQEKVKKGTKLTVNNLNLKQNEKIEFPVLFRSNENKGSNKKSIGKVIKQTKSKKIKILKFKNKSRYHKKTGHRQPLTVVEIIDI
jgi:large subunit ribosomal protein L21